MTAEEDRAGALQIVTDGQVDIIFPKNLPTPLLVLYWIGLWGYSLIRRMVGL